MTFIESFPSPEDADAEGLVAIGGDLSSDRLLMAYRMGIFPWYGPRLPILWWSPDPRAILELDRFHVSKSMRRSLNAGDYEISLDRDFPGVIRGCADRGGGETWITPEMMLAYQRLHREGYAHSLEVWRAGQLVGGVYGVAIGGFFAAESKFHREANMSKVALHYLVEVLRRGGFELLDIQILSDHTRSLGGREVTRAEFLSRLRRAIRKPAQFAPVPRRAGSP